jgi:hypothetical protein
MTNVGAFDNDGSDNFRIFSTNDLKIAANGENGTAITVDATNQDVTVTNDMTIAGNISAAGLSYPTSDGTADQVLVTDGAGTLSFADASGGGATVSSDTSTNTNFLLYFASTTTGDLTAVKQDSGLTYNPSTGLLTSAAFSGSGASLTALNGSNISTGTVAAARVATLNQNTTGTAGGLSSAVTVSLSGDVTGSATFTSAGDTASITTTIAANSVALGTDTTGNYVGTITGGTGINSSGATSGEGVAHTLSIDSTVATLTDSQTLTNKTLTSPVISTISNTGTLTLPTSTGTIALTSDIPTNNNQLTNGAGYTTNVGDITNVAVSGTGLSGGGASGSVTITSNATNANTASTIVARDASGNFSAGTITASLTGTASNAALLDSLDSTQFLRSDTADTKTSGDLSFSDNVKANFGAGNDLQIFHDTVNSYISEGGTGHLRIRASNLQLQDTSGNAYIEGVDTGTGGTVTLYHNAVAKLATKSDGVDITGELQSDSLDVDGNADISGTLTMGGNIDLQDNDDILIGSSDDLQLRHDGSNSYIEDIGTGSLYIRGTDIFVQDREGNNFIYLDDTGTGGTVTLYHNASAKLATSATGVTITGVMSGTATSARYADLAEKYTSDQDYEPGTVVELGGEHEVTLTRRSRSTAIAGVVSTNPAHLMNDQLVSEHVVDVALIGRVPCKVVGQVRKGDLLISSDEPGHAQAYKDIHNPPTGSVIGKAIESKDNEDPGVIEVLVGRL